MPQNKKIDIARRRGRVAEYKLQGLRNFEIAELLGVSPSQITLDLKSVSKEWRAERIHDIDEIKQRELLKLDLIEKKNWEAWDRSCQVKTKKSMKKKGSTTKLGKALGADDKEQTYTEEQQIGDPRYMAIILDCIGKREKIIGYGAAQKLEVNLENASDEQLNMFQQKLLELSNQVDNLK
jgi:hypothetical protein